MSNHTPGPWQRKGSLIFADRERPRGDLYIWAVANVCDIEDGLGPQKSTARANARLIASAPDLLHCLKVILSHAEGRGLDASLHLDEARAAVDKATGA